MDEITTESEKTVEQQACERLIDQIIRTAKNDLVSHFKVSTGSDVIFVNSDVIL